MAGVFARTWQTHGARTQDQLDGAGGQGQGVIQLRLLMLSAQGLSVLAALQARATALGVKRSAFKYVGKRNDNETRRTGAGDCGGRLSPGPVDWSTKGDSAGAPGQPTATWLRLSVAQGRAAQNTRGVPVTRTRHGKPEVERTTVVDDGSRLPSSQVGDRSVDSHQ